MATFPTQNARHQFLKICFPQQQKQVGENYDFLFKNSVGKYEDTLEHEVIYILYDLLVF